MIRCDRHRARRNRPLHPPRPAGVAGVFSCVFSEASVELTGCLATPSFALRASVNDFPVNRDEMPSLFDLRARASIQERIARLTPERKPAWGRLTAPLIVCHVSRDLRHALGELEAGLPSSPLAVSDELVRDPRHAVAQGAGQEPPEFLATRPAAWAADVGRLRDLVERFAARGRRRMAGEPGIRAHFRGELGRDGAQASGPITCTSLVFDGLVAGHCVHSRPCLVGEWYDVPGIDHIGLPEVA